MAQVTKGIVGEKVGMTQVFDDQSRVVPVTVIKAGPCHIAQVKTIQTDGYSAIQLAFGDTKESRLSKPEQGHLRKAGVSSFRSLVELRISDVSGFSVGQEIKADIFAKGEKADVVGVSKGKGFAGVMKRHNFRGKSASHGTQRKHRSPGAIGACATPSRVFKGMRMAGHMGHERVTVLNLEVVDADPERNLLLVRGAIPGPNGGLVVVRSAVRGGAA
ncbi:MAG TPA: 50S ribosomal protein L3 [Actinomycetota bacterium]|nr:50S ribosomal protein L3 [Actinomycetota bacterium]